MTDLTKIIEESIKKVINEGISDIVYHFCGLPNGYNICKTNKIFFMPSISTQSESELNGKNSYFLSTTRQRNSNFGYSTKYNSGNSVRITLDGRKLRENLSGRPTDYWYSPGFTLNSKQSYYKDKVSFSTAQQHASNESEDRLFSRKQMLEGMKRYEEEFRNHRGNRNPVYCERGIRGSVGGYDSGLCARSGLVLFGRGQGPHQAREPGRGLPPGQL